MKDVNGDGWVDPLHEHELTLPHVKACHGHCHYTNEKQDIQHFSKDPPEKGGMEHFVAWVVEEGRGAE